jgi:predicted DNA-binding transcriptional regulator AlpA
MVSIDASRVYGEHPMQDHHHRSLLKLRDVLAVFGGINASTLYRGIKLGRYPRPVKVGPGSSRWLKAECEAVLQAMVQGRAV